MMGEGGWEKIQSPMELLWKGSEWLSCGDVIAYNTLMNVSQFEGMNWYKAIEIALASYGAVMRYVGGNEVVVTTLRYMPHQGSTIDGLPRIEPVFVAGAQREFVPAVKRIEESVDYKIASSQSVPQVKESDFIGEEGSYLCEIEGDTWGTLEHSAPIWSITNRDDEGWGNDPQASLFFNIDAYPIGYFSNYRGLGEEIKRYMYIAANNTDSRSVWYRKNIQRGDLDIIIKFGLPVSLNKSYELEQQISFALKSVQYIISIEKDGEIRYSSGDGRWQLTEKVLEKTFDISREEMTFSAPVRMDESVGAGILTFEILKIEYAQIGYGSSAQYGLYACIYDFAFAKAEVTSIREKNTVNTIYNANNNVILSRNPEIGPAYDGVSIPAFIQNGIFYRSADGILPARLWSWKGSSEQQMAVWNHLQLLSYYAKPNNLISGTIVNADTTRYAAIYDWHRTEHILISGRVNYLTGHIESAVLREFTRYEYMWSDIEGATLPETEQNSKTNVEGGASSSAASSTYTNTTNVNIGSGSGGSGASSLDELNDVNVQGVTAQSILYYNGTEWVNQSKSAFLKQATDRITTLEGFWYDENGMLCTDKDIHVKGNIIADKEVSAGGVGTEEGGGGGTGDYYKMYHHPQDEAASVWRVEHGLGKFPNVRVLDSNKELCYGDVQYINTSVLTITFGAPFSGDAYCD
jgi:hypothetical protein